MLRYEVQSPIVARSSIVRVEKRVRATRIGDTNSKVSSVAQADQRSSENWFERAWKKLMRAA